MEKDPLFASLNLIGRDTRAGLSDDAKKDIKAVSAAYESATPELRAQFKTYAQKLGADPAVISPDAPKQK